jgi:hypothetical protein
MDDVDKRWRKSSYSTNDGNCVEVATQAGIVRVRDSKDPKGPELRMTAEDWRRFTASIKG